MKTSCRCTTQTLCLYYLGAGVMCHTSPVNWSRARLRIVSPPFCACVGLSLVFNFNLISIRSAATVSQTFKQVGVFFLLAFPNKPTDHCFEMPPNYFFSAPIRGFVLDFLRYTVYSRFLAAIVLNQLSLLGAIFENFALCQHNAPRVWQLVGTLYPIPTVVILLKCEGFSVTTGGELAW